MPTGIPDQLTGFSPCIARPSVAVLLGAGVSKGFEFRLMGGEDYESLWSDFQDHLKSGHCDGILKYVQLQGRPNLEDVFEQIELISRSANTLKKCEHCCSIAVDAEKAALMIGPFVAKWYAFPTEDGSKRADALYTQLLEAIWPATRSNVLPVFTTNYDLALEEFCGSQSISYDLVQGFEGGLGKWNASHLHTVGASPRQRKIVLMKLHGSTGWGSGEDDSVVALPVGLRKDDFHRAAGGLEQQAMVVPVRSKAPYREPYLTYFAYLEECAANAEGLIILGYALNELGVRNAIGTGLSRRQGLPLHVLVVDIKPPDCIGKLKKLAPPNTIVLAELVHDFGSDDPSQLGTTAERWVAEFVESFDMSPRSRVWAHHESDPAGMVSATDDQWVIEWADNAVFDKPGYWEWRLPTGATEFTVSFEIRAEKARRGWYPGVQLVSEGGAENVVAMVLARGGSPVHTTGPPDNVALATVPGRDRWSTTSPWGSGIAAIGNGEWIQAELRVRGLEYQGFVRGEPNLCPWRPLHARPWLLRGGAFGEETVVQHARCLLRNLHFRRGVEKS